jgi:hypothetical protein
MTVEAAMRARYASCATYEDHGTCTLANYGEDGTESRRTGVFRFKTLFARATGAFRFECGDHRAPWVVLWRTAAGPVRVWSVIKERVEEHSLERAVMRHASRSHRTAGVVSSMLVPTEIARFDATPGWAYEREEEDRSEEEPLWRLSVGDTLVARVAWVDRSFALRKLSIRDQSVCVDYETKPCTRRSTTVEATILYMPTFDQPIDMGRFRFAPPNERS